MQISVSSLPASQDNPPCAGAGLSHDRVRDLVPSLHVTLQADHVIQADQPPSTKSAITGKMMKKHVFI